MAYLRVTWNLLIPVKYRCPVFEFRSQTQRHKPLTSYYCSSMPSTFPCTVGKLNVHNNHRAIFCDSCHNWAHLKCSSFTRLEYSAMFKSNDGWFCSTCLASIFPFNHFDNDIDFLFALFDFNSLGNFDTGLLKQKNFNPFFGIIEFKS